LQVCRSRNWSIFHNTFPTFINNKVFF
jgi:hypothetical protein